MGGVPRMTSSFDKESSGGPSYSKPGINKSPLHADSHSQSQPSEAELSLANTATSKEGSSFDDSVVPNNTARFQRGGLHQLKPLNAVRCDWSSSTDEESDESDDWDEKQRDDPVGDMITSLLNEGMVPHFGYIRPHIDPLALVEVEDDLKWYPLLSARNYRAMRKLLLEYWNRDSVSSDRQCDSKRDNHSMRFILETFVICYVSVYAMNDIVLRSLSEFAYFTVLGAIGTFLFDMEEVRHVSLLLLSSATPAFSLPLIGRCRTVAREIFGIIEREFLWGFHFQGRTILWSDYGHLIKFRRKHRRLMATHNERRHNRRDRRRSRAERRRREKRKEEFTPEEMEKMEHEFMIHDQLDAVSKHLTMKPPTFLPSGVSVKVGTDTSLKSNGSNKHMESLQYCHSVIFIAKREEKEVLKKVEIRPTSHVNRTSTKSHRSTMSPRESIEVVDQFPDIGTTISSDRDTREEDSVSTSLSDTSYSVRYDQGSDYSSSGENDDSDSIGSYASETTARSMPWMVVGAKIGHKLLTARKFRRVIANPDAAQKLIPEEAMKIIDGMNKKSSKKSSSPESHQPSLQASSWEGPSSSEDLSPKLGLGHDITQSKSIDLPDIKAPVHGMWTNAGAVAQTPGSYGAVTLESPATVESFHSPNSDHNDIITTSHRTPPRPRWRFTPPTSPQVKLQQLNKTPPVSERGVDNMGYKTSTPLIKRMPKSPLNNKQSTFSPATTPQSSNSSRKIFNFDIHDTDPPAPVTRLAPIEKGVKMVIPMFPSNTRQSNATIAGGSCFYQMGTVMSSRRIHVGEPTMSRRKKKTNCLAIKVILDKALLRGSKFVEMNLRIMDEWNYIPRHSKFPIGSCVATTFGVGVLVGWRVEDDMHIIRSLWNRSGPGSGLAYLRRDTIHSVVEAATGFEVQTTYGAGKVVAYVNGGKKNTKGKYFVQLNGRLKSRVMEFNRCQILSCQGAKFVPVTEHIRAAALYRLEVLHYKANLREQMLNGPSKGVRHKGMWRNFSEYVDLFANSFSKAIAEDPDFDGQVDKFVSHIITLLDAKKDSDDLMIDPNAIDENIGICPSSPVNEGFCTPAPVHENDTKTAAGVSWNINELFGCFFVDPKEEAETTQYNHDVMLQAQAFEEAHDSAEILIRVFLRTLTVARASVPDRPKLHIALAMMHEGLLFVRQILRVQKKNTSRKLIEAWFGALNEISTTFGPLKQRTAKLGVQIANKFRKHGSIAKRRILRFVDRVLGDTQLLHALELGDWRSALSRLEVAIVKADITDAKTCEQLHRGISTVYKNLAPRKKDRKSKDAAARNGQKIINFAKIMKIIASPGRSIMRLLTFDEVLALFDRVLVRVFDKDPLCSTVINIYAFNFDSIRHLRTLNNMPIAGKLWETILDAIDEELSFATSEIPEQTKYFIDPIVKLFSLGVSQFHCIQSGGSTADWLDFLMTDESVKIIQELDYKLIESLESLCNDIKQVVQVLPYIKTIDNDILNLMDEFNFDLFLSEISDIVGDAEKSMAYITERSAVLVERFLDYLPRMSIPIERRELQDGWVLTCRSKDGGDLRLSDISVLRENLLLTVLGSKNVFHPLSGKDFIGSPTKKSLPSVGSELTDDDKEETVLDEIMELISSAQAHGAWIAGVGGLKESCKYKGVPRQLVGVPMSDNLSTQIDMWQASAISDFELLETAIREVSYQIQLQKEREEQGIELPPQQETKHHFNPRLDPTILFLDIKNLTLLLEEFGFRVEKGEPLTIFDPVFEGCGSITVKNVSISLKVEVKKERVYRGGRETPRPVLQLAQFEVELEKVKLEFMETGADWILNAVLKGFCHQITEIVQENLKEQIVKQVHTVLEQVNNFVDANPDLLMHSLGITMKDLDETVVCV